MAEIAAEIGVELMPWQRFVVDTALEVGDDGLLVYDEIILTVPRQSGKSTMLMALAAQRCMMTMAFGDRQDVVYTAQTRQAARVKWEEDHVRVLSGSPLARHFTVKLANGAEQIRWKNGSRWGIEASTEKAGHGLTIDLAMVDEAFALVDDRLEQAFKPAMITRPQPQMWVVSTAGTADSTYLNAKTKAGRDSLTNPDSSTAFFEWSAEPDADPADPGTWWGCMPALGVTQTERRIRSRFESMSLSEFKRAFLNIPTIAALHEPVWSPEVWTALGNAADPIIQAPGLVAFAVDVNPDRSGSAIAVAGRTASGFEGVQVVDRFTGTQGVVDECVRLVREYSAPLVLDAAGAAGSLMTDLLARGVHVDVMSLRDVTAACGGISDAVVEGRLRHGDQPVLTAAVMSAKKRELAGAWAWQKRDAGDICPLVAVTFAHHAWSKVAALSDTPMVAFL